MRRLLILVLLFPSLGSAQQRKSAQCQDGKPPEFTGQPFRPTACRPAIQEYLGKAKTPTDAELPPLPSRDKASLAGFEGKWSGLVRTATGRFEVTVEIAREGRKASAKLSLRDYSTFQNYEFAGSLKNGFFSPRKVSGHFEITHPIQDELSASGWIGAAGPGYDREILVRLDDRGAWHRLALIVDGAKLRFDYRASDPKRAVAVSGELNRAAN